MCLFTLLPDTINLEEVKRENSVAISQPKLFLLLSQSNEC